MVSTLVPIIVAVAAVFAAVFRHLVAVRAVALAIIFFAALLSFGGLIVPHRIAEDLHRPQLQTAEWQQGARDTRDAVYRGLPLLVTSFFSVFLLAIVPARATRPSNQTMQRTPTRRSPYLSDD